MNKWVLLQQGQQPPALAPDEFILLAMAQGGILRVMYRFVKNIRGNIAGYLIHDHTTLAAHDWHSSSTPALPYWVKLRQQPRIKTAPQRPELNLH
ncbi:hypothetical protein LMJ53_08095 [Rheinheimera sp. UJ51]|uniref:hypothetical protein n=1 Tax=Rheinheimera sp. UJ51 TaxID=2892446 RepID=UPI001E4D56D2|nr:hypothetical protein [Rheinheimera sp. UJ51]MCC5451685.1 hypothetical protein [Rheinheimera sp. UJ51]